MLIRNHRLCEDGGKPMPFEVSPNTGGGPLEPKYLVIHYTAGRDLVSSVATLTDPSSRASAHLVIGRDGRIVQLVPFNRVAWHAGVSRWHGLEGLNRHSLGIELDNAGRLERDGNAWRAWFGKTYPSAEVVEAIHKHETKSCGWHRYTEAQIDAVVHIGQRLTQRYGLIDVIGHDDIAPLRKSDPGPAFPLDNVRSAVLGRSDDALETFVTVASLNVRTGPGIQFERVTAKALAPGTRLKFRARDSSWCFVDVLDAKGKPNLSGWVHGDYVRPV